MSGTGKLSVKPRPTGTAPSKPPPKPKKPSNLKFLRAQYGFIASEEGELTFNEGDLLCILDDKSDPDWWKARVKVKRHFHILLSNSEILTSMTLNFS